MKAAEGGVRRQGKYAIITVSNPRLRVESIFMLWAQLTSKMLAEESWRKDKVFNSQILNNIIRDQMLPMQWQ